MKVDNHIVWSWTRRFAAAGLLLIPLVGYSDTVGYWRFEDSSGAVAADQTSVYPGDLIGFDNYDPGGGDSGFEGWSTNVSAATIPQSGVANTGSIRMQGGGEFVDLSNGQDMSLGLEFTVEMFMRPDQPVGSSPAFVLGGFSSASFALTESLGVRYWNMGFNTETPYTLATGVEVGIWQHVALVKVPGTYSIYIDGILEASGPVGSAGDGPYYFPGTDNTGDRTIGGDSGTFRGWIDEFRISDEALSPNQFLNAAIPEPGTLGLLGLGLFAFVFQKRK